MQLPSDGTPIFWVLAPSGRHSGPQGLKVLPFSIEKCPASLEILIGALR